MPAQNTRPWLIVAAFFAVTMTLGETLYTFGVFFKPLQEEFGWNRSLVSSGSTAFLIGYAISVLIAGRLVDRYRPRSILLVSAVLAGLGIALASQVNNIDQFRVYFLIAGLGSGATFSVPTSTVQRLFRDRPGAGTALAIVLVGAGVGQLFFPPLMNHLIINYGWRNAYLAAGIIYFLVIAIAALPVNVSPATRSNQPATSLPAGTWNTRRAMTTLAFPLVVFAACAGTIAFQAATVHLVPHATDLGVSPTAAAALMGLVGGLTIPGRFLSGAVSGRISWQKTLAVSLLGVAVSMVLLIIGQLWTLYAFAFVFGTFWGMRMVAQVGIVQEFFGLHSIGELIGINSAVSTATGAFAPYIAGFIFDSTGSYLIAFAILGVLSLAGGLAVLLVRNPQPGSGKH